MVVWYSGFRFVFLCVHCCHKRNQRRCAISLLLHHETVLLPEKSPSRRVAAQTRPDASVKHAVELARQLHEIAAAQEITETSLHSSDRTERCAISSLRRCKPFLLVPETSPRRRVACLGPHNLDASGLSGNRCSIRYDISYEQDRRYSVTQLTHTNVSKLAK